MPGGKKTADSTTTANKHQIPDRKNPKTSALEAPISKPNATDRSQTPTETQHNTEVDRTQEEETTTTGMTKIETNIENEAGRDTETTDTTTPETEAHTDTTTAADRTPPAALTEGRPTPNPY